MPAKLERFAKMLFIAAREFNEIRIGLGLDLFGNFFPSLLTSVIDASQLRVKFFFQKLGCYILYNFVSLFRDTNYNQVLALPSLSFISSKFWWSFRVADICSIWDWILWPGSSDWGLFCLISLLDYISWSVLGLHGFL